MPDEPNENGQTQETQPKRGKPARIPVPKRKDVFRDLEKIAKPWKSSQDGEAEPSA